MNTRKTLILRILSFLPALSMMCLIFSFSGQTGTQSGSLSHRISYTIVDVGSDLLGKDFTEAELNDYADKLEFPIRKLAHMTEYLILFLLVCLPLFVNGLRGRRLLITAAVLCIAFAASDEYHQSFVAGRGPSVKDVGIDSIGVLIGAAFMRLILIFRTP